MRKLTKNAFYQWSNANDGRLTREQSDALYAVFRLFPKGRQTDWVPLILANKWDVELWYDFLDMLRFFARFHADTPEAEHLGDLLPNLVPKRI